LIKPERNCSGFCLLVLDDYEKVPRIMKFSELIRVLEQDGFRLLREKGSISKSGHDKSIRVDFMGQKRFRQEPAMLF
jgi:hypothetical protein